MQVNKCNSLVLLQRNTRLSGIRKAQCLFQLPLVRNGQLSAAFCTATGQYLAAIGCFHALSETMYRFTAAAMRLKCTFHDLISLCSTKSPGEADRVSIPDNGHTITRCL
jgi:hypothetical protein